VTRTKRRRDVTQLYNPSPHQEEGFRLLCGPATHVLLRGGARSGKTVQIIRFLVVRALMASGSTHAIFRNTFASTRTSLIKGTVPMVMEMCFPEREYTLNQSEWCHTFENGSKFYYGGLDDKERTDKILGQEHASIFLNECSQISYSSRNKSVTRLSQHAVIDLPGSHKLGDKLRLKMIYDCNPPSMAHWSYPMFMQHIEPMGRTPLDPADYATLINPIHNLENLDPQTIKNLEALPEKEKKRFLYGDYTANVVGALWDYDSIKRIEAPDPKSPDYAERFRNLLDRLKNIVVAVDPSGCSGDEDKRSDEVGIVVCGKGYDGIGYVLEDLSGHYAPEGWAKAAVNAFVGEQNYGGDMVRGTIHGYRRNVPYRKVTASRGKHVRAEPISSLYASNKVFHVGTFVDMETQMMSFSQSGYMGERSPDRADAMVWGLTELMIDHKRGEFSQGFVKGMYG
jgi:phage terminase large subunit-like protein